MKDDHLFPSRQAKSRLIFFDFSIKWQIPINPIWWEKLAFIFFLLYIDFVWSSQFFGLLWVKYEDHIILSFCFSQSLMYLILCTSINKIEESNFLINSNSSNYICLINNIVYIIDISSWRNTWIYRKIHS